ncbi:MAG TPA: right-handed parallel beta-helix repeat-containing protein [Phycisphaerae bacterium]|nr:right-handed parallel beta-helix repeat-containing protein [Phycisphaerae bacterium]
MKNQVFCMMVLAWVCVETRLLRADPRVVYVDAGVAVSGNGNSWQTAKKTLPEGISAALPSTPPYQNSVWVKAGEYKPSATDPGITFSLAANVRVYGGFAGTEDPATFDPEVEGARDFDVNETTLSGEMGDPDEFDDNAFCVVTASGGSIDDFLLDGFTVTRGVRGIFNSGGADGVFKNLLIYDNNDVIEGQGAGMLIVNASSSLSECVFRQNRANTGLYSGGGLAIIKTPSGPTVFVPVTACTFEDNETVANGGLDWGGGGAYLRHAGAEFISCRFIGNRVTNGMGGGLHIEQPPSTVYVALCEFSDNEVVITDADALKGGGGLFSHTSANVQSCTFRRNRVVNGADAPFGWGGGALALKGSLYTNSEFIDNSAGKGGGMAFGILYDILHAVDMRNATVVRNTAGQEGGGLYVHFDQDEFGNVSNIANVIAWGNQANCLTNCTDDELSQVYINPAQPAVTVTDTIIENYSPTGPFAAAPHADNFGDDPVFFDENGQNNVTGDDDDNFRLTWCSPAVDRANSAGFPRDTLDLDDDDVTTDELLPDQEATNRDIDNPQDDAGSGDPAYVDLGAFEFHDCDENGIDDTAEIRACRADPLCIEMDDDFDGIIDDCEPVIFDPGPLERDGWSSIPLEPTTISDLQFDGNWMMVGSANDDLLTNAGAVYFYRLNQIFWYGPARKTSSNSQMHNAFGRSVAISGGWAVAGAPGADGFAGEANVFKLNVPRKTWSEYDLLESPTGIYVGTTVAIHDDVIAVAGASDSAVSGSSNGLVYIHHYNATTEEWELKDALVPSVGNALYFGLSLAVGEDWIAVGYSVDESGLPAGVEMFHYDGTDWDENVLLDYPGLSDQDESGFGISVAMEDDLMVVGAVGYGPGDGNGEAYVYHLDAGVWTHVEALNVDDVGADDLFGRDVDVRPTLLQDSVVLVGAPLQEANDSGAAYMFMLNECHDEYLSHELQPDSPMSGGNFGHPLSQSGLHGVILHPRGQSADMLLSHVVTWSWVN